MLSIPGWRIEGSRGSRDRGIEAAGKEPQTEGCLGIGTWWDSFGFRISDLDVRQASAKKNRGSGSQREATTHRERRPATTSTVCRGARPRHSILSRRYWSEQGKRPMQPGYFVAAETADSDWSGQAANGNSAGRQQAFSMTARAWRTAKVTSVRLPHAGLCFPQRDRPTLPGR
jgi:hypothetical protein